VAHQKGTSVEAVRFPQGADKERRPFYFNSVTGFRMTASELEVQYVEYRSYSLRVSHRPPQWLIEAVPMRTDLPELAIEKQVTRGWDQEGTVQRAKARVDAVLEGRHPN
jgi:hypothetical protein